MRIQVLLTAAVFCASALASTETFARDPLTNIDGMAVHQDALAPGETLSRLFTREGISREEGELFVRTLRRHLNLRRMAAGQTVILYRSAPVVGDVALRAVAIPLRRGRSVVAVRDGDSDRVRGGVYGDEEAADWIETAIGTGTEAALPGPRRFKLRRGDNLVMALLRAGATRDDAHRAATGLRHHVNLRRLAIGEPIDVEFSTRGGKAVLEAVALPNRGRNADLRRDAFGVFRPVAEMAAAELQPPPPAVQAPNAPRRFKLRRGDNLVMALLRAGATRDDAHRAATGLRHRVNLRRLAIGEPIDVEFSTRDGKTVLEAVALPNRGRNADLRRDAFGVFRPVAEMAAAELQPPPPPVEQTPAATPGQADEFAQVGDRLVSRGPGSRFDDTFKRGDTLGLRLQRAGMSLTEIRGAVRAFAKEMRPTAIIAGQRFAYGVDGGSVTYFAVSDRRRKSVLVARTATGEWTAQRIDWSDIGVTAERLASRAWPRDLENQRAAVQEERLQSALEQTHIRSGDILLSVLAGIGERRAHAHAAAAAFGKVARADRLQPGQKLIFPRAAAELPLTGFFLETRAKRKRGVLVLRDSRGRYRAAWADTADAEAQLAALAPEPQQALAPDLSLDPPSDADPVRSESNLPDGSHVERLKVAAKSGDTLAKILVSAGADRAQVDKAVRAISGEFDPRTLDIGQVLHIAVGAGDKGARPLEGFAIQLDPLRSVEAVLEDDAYVTHRVERTFHVVFNRTVGAIDTSLYQAADNMGLPIPVLEQLVRIFSFEVDFQRDLQPGDEFEVMYEGQVVDGEMVDHGRIVYAAMVVRGEKRSLYYFDPVSAPTGYFDGEGRSAARALMRTPIDGARISSRFGMRRHPILGFNRMHRGMDFAAPTGTPVYAAGDGVIERIGRYGAYGKYIRIRHNSEYKTAYAHLSRYAKGLRRGSRVAQGQVIGRVGSTGRSTGPHLHYEVLYRNKQVNPQTINLPSPVFLEGDNLARFLSERNRFDQAWNDFGPGVARVAVRPSDGGPAFN